jgi:carboxypeptidase PM20D1
MVKKYYYLFMFFIAGLIIKGQLKNLKTMNALIRTTIAPTVIKAGSKENVLPQIARAKINFWLYPGESAEYVIEHVKKVTFISCNINDGQDLSRKF